MSIISKLYKSSIFFIVAINNFSYSWSQTIPDPKIESPNAATLEKFGEIPVDLFTGTPNISIPIHTLSYGKINVPIR